MDKIETRHGTKLKPMIRHIIGKQSRMTLKSVADSMRGHNAEAENNAENNLAKEKLATRKRSSVSSKKSLTSIRGSQSSQSSQIEDENTSISSQGSEFSPIPSGRSIPRTPLVECNVEIMDKVDNQGSPDKVETDKLSVIPKGNSIPRSPIVGSQSQDHFKAARH